MKEIYYELAVHKGIRGVITKNFINKNSKQRSESFTAGNELLQEYILAVDDENPNIQYIDHVYTIMRKNIVGKPLGFSSILNIKTASDFFIGYLMFDALISNQDRHNENWGMIITSKGDKHLAPSYDHGASLARNESDMTRQTRLESTDIGQKIETYVKRAKSQFQNSETGKRLKLLEAFRLYGLMENQAALTWLNKLKEINHDQIKSIIDKVPDKLMSDVAKRFTLELIICNKENLLQMYNELSKDV